MLTRILRLLVLLLLAGPVAMAAVSFDPPSPSRGIATIGIGKNSNADDTPRLTRLGQEIDDLREAIFGPNLRFEPVRRARAAFAPRHAERIETLRDPPPDRPPRSIA